MFSYQCIRTVAVMHEFIFPRKTRAVIATKQQTQSNKRLYIYTTCGIGLSRRVGRRRRLRLDRIHGHP